MGWSVYVLQSLEDGRFYIGSTSDIAKRLVKHNTGGVDATKHRRPLLLRHCEELQDKKSALDRERYLKSLKSHRAIEGLIGGVGRAPR